MTVTTPTVRAALRRARYWIVAAVLVLLVAIAGIAVSGSGGGSGVVLGASDATPEGSRALVEVLRDEGVDVTPAATLDQVRDGASGGSTVLVFDDSGVLDADGAEQVAGLADRVVLVRPGDDVLSALAPDLEPGEDVGEARSLPARCPLPAAERAGTLWADGAAYRAAGGDAETCFDGVVAEDGEVTVLGSLLPLQNGTIAREGNAAFALGLLGQDPSLVWYLPNGADAALGDPPTVAELTPPWVTPVIVLLLLTGLAAMVWRGRRTGPLVVERLPVVVRASETMEGRARLYAGASARLRALDALRLGAVGRLRERCGLPRTAHLDEVVDAVARATGDHPAAVRALLVDREPGTDAELVALSDALLVLERRVADATRAR